MGDYNGDRNSTGHFVVFDCLFVVQSSNTKKIRIRCVKFAFYVLLWQNQNLYALPHSICVDFISWIKSHLQHKYVQLIFGFINIHLGDKSNSKCWVNINSCEPAASTENLAYLGNSLIVHLLPFSDLNSQ